MTSVISQGVMDEAILLQDRKIHLSFEYFTCVHCGGLIRQESDTVGMRAPKFEVVIVSSPPCQHPWWDESGLCYRPVGPGEVQTMMAEHKQRKPPGSYQT